MATLSLRPSSKGVTSLIVVAAIVFFGCVLIFFAAEGKIRARSKKQDELETQVASSRQMAEKLQQTKLAYQDSCSQIKCLESSVATQAYVPTLLQQLEHLGKSVNLKVLGVRPQPKEVTPAAKPGAAGAKPADSAGQAKTADAGDTAKKADPYDELKIDVDVEGSYNNALDFLYKLTSFPKIVAVNSVQMAPVSANKSIGSPRLSIKLNITAFVLKEPAPQTGPKTPATSMSSRAFGMTVIRRPANEAG